MISKFQSELDAYGPACDLPRVELKPCSSLFYILEAVIYPCFLYCRIELVSRTREVGCAAFARKQV